MAGVAAEYDGRAFLVGGGEALVVAGGELVDAVHPAEEDGVERGVGRVLGGVDAGFLGVFAVVLALQFARSARAHERGYFHKADICAAAGHICPLDILARQEGVWRQRDGSWSGVIAASIFFLFLLEVEQVRRRVALAAGAGLARLRQLVVL